VVRATASARVAMLLLPLLAPGAVALASSSTYSGVTGDLFPDDPDVDLDLRVSGTAYWRLDAPDISPGTRASAGLQPRAGPLEVEVRFRLPRPCCERQFVEGTRTVAGRLALADEALPSLTLDDWALELRIGGPLFASAATQGAGAAAGEQRTWNAWDPQAVDVGASADARPGDRVLLQLASEQRARIGARIVAGERVLEAPPTALVLAGTAASFSVLVGSQSAAPAGLGLDADMWALAGTASAAAVLGAAALLTRRRAPPRVPTPARGGTRWSARDAPPTPRQRP
jgi:hypothetical protein